LCLCGYFRSAGIPFAIDPRIDYSSEPTRLVVFKLEEIAGGTQLTITESGFDRIPLARRAKAFTSNEQGWMAQTKLIEKWDVALERLRTAVESAEEQ
jgi:hypothetical protein